MTWLNRDALNRAWRTLLQTLALVVLAPAADAAYQVVTLAFADGAFSRGYEWGRLADRAWQAAIMGASLSLLAYVHRRVVDPSRVPSAQPPRANGEPR